MKKLILTILIILIASFVAIQFVPVEKPKISDENPDDLILNHSENIPIEIQKILVNSCYDCHSYQPSMPWYSKVAPVKWLVIKDINEGTEELNFSVWNKMDAFSQMAVLDEINSEIQEGEMPLDVYTIMNKDAVISDKEKQLISEWVEEFQVSLSENMWE
jgi:hypothetical protein